MVTPSNFEKSEKSNPKEINLIQTGPQAQTTENHLKWYKLSTQDLLLGAILGVMGGFISGLIPFSLLVKTWYPFVGGTQLVSGHHLLWMFIAYGLTRKYLIIFFTATIKGFINFLFGADWGALEIGISLYEAFFLFLGILLVKSIREDTSFLGWGLAGGLGNVAQVPLFWIVTGKIYFLNWTLFVMACMFGFLSGVLITGVLGKLIVNGLKEAGIL